MGGRAYLRFPKEGQRDKEILVRMFGGRCSDCGFSDHLKALHFTTCIPTQKNLVYQIGSLEYQWKNLSKKQRSVFCCVETATLNITKNK
jgi:hypothetical protein